MKAVEAEDEWEEDESQQQVVLTIQVSEIKQGKQTACWKEVIKVNGRKIQLKMDTGAEVSLLPYYSLKKLKSMPEISPTKVRLFSYSGHEIKTLGKCMLKCVVKENETEANLDFFVTNDLEPILGLKAMKQLKLVPNLHAISSSLTAEGLINEFSNIFIPGEIIKCKPYQY